ncbi:MAG: Na(+)-translocating NADH-quinone reductase subunit A [Lentisphaerae bacterium]|nr:Na(+)-translocating NADH-quinone reductase subunit A [Lentisphaerota bacterium]
MASASVRIRKGLDLPFSGAPAPAVAEGPASPTVALQPAEFDGVKPRLLVKEGDRVRRGTALFFDKRNEALRFCSPAAGTVKSIVYGPRRSIESVAVAVGGADEAESFGRFTPAQIAALPREQVLAPLLASGLLALIRQRPYSGIADPAATPRAVFVNAMSTAPFRADADVVVRGDEAAFQAGLDVLARLTPGTIHLVLPDRNGLSPALTGARGVEIHRFSGPHPSGNTSIHIHHIDPIRPGDIVWTVRAADVPLIGRLFLTGELPSHRVIALGGPGVAAGAARHYRVRIGAALGPLLAGRTAGSDLRIIAGDALAGTAVKADGHLPAAESSLTVLPEGRERLLLSWANPFTSAYSASKLYLSSWIGGRRTWPMHTNVGGGHRAMVVTGLYDRYVPMRILTDFLIRAVLAKDWEEAVKLGLLELDPEDLAVAAYACPSKVDLVGILRTGLAEARAEGI